MINTMSPSLLFFLLGCFGCQEQIMCLLNIHLITVDEGPLLCREVTFQMPFDKSSSLTYPLTDFSFQVEKVQARIELFSQWRKATAVKKKKKNHNKKRYDIKKYSERRNSNMEVIARQWDELYDCCYSIIVCFTFLYVANYKWQLRGFPCKKQSK